MSCFVCYQKVFACFLRVKRRIKNGGLSTGVQAYFINLNIEGCKSTKILNPSLSAHLLEVLLRSPIVCMVYLSFGEIP